MSNVKEKVEKITGKKVVAQKVGTSTQVPPTREQFREWITRDLKSALAFLDYVRLVPGLQEQIADAIYEDAMRGPKLPVNGNS